MHKVAAKNYFHDMLNPGVQVNIVYSNLLKTNSKNIYKEDPSIKTKRNEFYQPDSTES